MISSTYLLRERGPTLSSDDPRMALELFARIDSKLDTLTAGLNQQMIRLARLEERDQTETVKGLARAVESMGRKLERLQDHTLAITTLERDLAAIRSSQEKTQAFNAGRDHVVKQGWELGKFVAEHGGKIAMVVMAGWMMVQTALVTSALQPRVSTALPYAATPDLRP